MVVVAILYVPGRGSGYSEVRWFTLLDLVSKFIRVLSGQIINAPAQLLHSGFKIFQGNVGLISQLASRGVFCSRDSGRAFTRGGGGGATLNWTVGSHLSKYGHCLRDR